MKPLIGITTNYVPNGRIGTVAQIGGPDQQWHALANDYMDAVLQGGGLPIIIPVLTNQQHAIPDFLHHLDGILFSGGWDIAPLSYGSDTTCQVGEISPQRDYHELALARAALNTPGFPFLGICRGCQLLNVTLGGSLVLDMDPTTSGDHSLTQQPMSVPTHKIYTQENSLIHTFLGSESTVNSYHHQCVDQLGSGVVITARDSHDLPEAIEVPSRQGFTLGVQWHPEGLAPNYPEHQHIFDAFVKAAAKNRKGG